MFGLRKITGSGVEMNFYLGNSYTLITKEVNEDEFNSVKERLNFEDCIYGFVSCHSGAAVHELSSHQQSYIVSADGSTYSNLTQK